MRLHCNWLKTHLSFKTEYLEILSSAARSAAAPASLAVAATYESATVQTAVTSQADIIIIIIT